MATRSVPWLLLLAVIGGCRPAQPMAAGKTQAQAAAPAVEAEIVQDDPFVPEPAERTPPVRPVQTAPVAPPKPEPVYRPNDDHPEHDESAMAALGIHGYRSGRLTLWTDISAEQAQALLPLADQFYDQLAAGLGPLPPARDGKEFHVYGYLMADEAKFREAGCLPEDLPTFEHGRNRHNVFWMRDQPYAYYREHLMLHEITHCYMLAPTHTELYPVWVMEGLAEHFAVHRLDEQGRLQTGLMPESPEAVAGFGRITLIREECLQQRGLNVAAVLQLKPSDFSKVDGYAWSWGLCHFLWTHPTYGDIFRGALREAPGPGFTRELARRFQSVERDLLSEWMLFAINLCYGYDTQRAAIDFQPGKPLTDSAGTYQLRADRGWQSSQVRVAAGEKYRITATGRVTLAEVPKPWISEPQGITFRYHDGWPLGLVLLTIHSETGPTGGADDSLRQVLPIGRVAEFTAPVTGTIYLRVNDAWNSLVDNAGDFQLSVSRVRGSGGAADN